MSTSDKRQLRRSAGKYLVLSALCGIFSLVYEQFSHGVRSGFMILLFLFPLLLGALPALALTLLPGSRAPGPAVRTLWNSAVATLALGSCLTGIFAIYGTTAPLVTVYWVAGLGLLAAALGLYLLRGLRETAA